MFGNDSGSYSTFISTIMPHISPCSCREYVQTICALTPNTLTTPSNETTGIFYLPHPFVKVDLLPFVNDFHLEMEVTLDRKTFISTLACSPHLSSDGPSYMVYQLLQDYFVIHHYANGFNLFFKVFGHIA
jgi:hypothetical protein